LIVLSKTHADDLKRDRRHALCICQTMMSFIRSSLEAPKRRENPCLHDVR